MLFKIVVHNKQHKETHGFRVGQEDGRSLRKLPELQDNLRCLETQVGIE